METFCDLIVSHKLTDKKEEEVEEVAYSNYGCCCKRCKIDSYYETSDFQSMQTAAPGPKMSYTNLVQEVSIGYLKQILKQLSLSGVDAQHMIFT